MHARPAPPTSVLVIPRPTAEDAFCSCSPVELTREVLTSKFHMRLSDAAKSLGISITSFKQVCRKLGLARWPRRLQSHPTRTGADAASNPRAESDDNNSDDMSSTTTTYAEENAPAPSESRKRRAEPAAMQQTGPWAHAQAIRPPWPTVVGGSTYNMSEFRVADGESYKRSRHTARDAQPHELAAPGAQPSPPPFPVLGLPNNLSWGGLPTSRTNQRNFVPTMDVSAFSLPMAASSSPLDVLSDLHRSTAISSSLPSAPVLFSQQQLMMTALQQSALSPTAFFEQQTAAAQQNSLQQGSQSFQTLNEQILATKLQIATLEASFQQYGGAGGGGFFMQRGSACF